jgi:hypothetical protein
LRQTDVAVSIIEIYVGRIVPIARQHHEPGTIIANLAKRLACAKFAEIQLIDVGSKAEIGLECAQFQ